MKFCSQETALDLRTFSNTSHNAYTFYRICHHVYRRFKILRLLLHMSSIIHSVVLCKRKNGEDSVSSDGEGYIVKRLRNVQVVCKLPKHFTYIVLLSFIFILFNLKFYTVAVFFFYYICIFFIL